MNENILGYFPSSFFKAVNTDGNTSRWWDLVLTVARTQDGLAEEVGLDTDWVEERLQMHRSREQSITTKKRTFLGPLHATGWY